MEKTIKDWFQQLEEPYKTQALENLEHNAEIPKDQEQSLPSALLWGFMWHSTPQGRDYWEDLYYSFYKP